jgi:predicted dehydrogenase
MRRLTRPTIAVVGLGRWGSNLLRALMDREDTDVAWVCDLSTERLTPLTRRYPRTKGTTNIEDLLTDSSLDAIVIATPVCTHEAIASKSLVAGKHTFVEKPLARSTGTADELIELARQRDLVLMCGLTFLYSPAVREIKRMIDDDHLGELYFVSSSRVNLGIHQPDVNVVWDLGPHDFSILLYWLEQMPTAVRALGCDAVMTGVPDVAFINLTFPSGVLANVELSWLAPGKLRRTVVVGSKKMVVYDEMSPEPVKVFDHGVMYRDPETFGQYQLSYRTGDVVSPALDTAEPISLQLGDFITAIVAGVTPPGHVGLARDVVALAEIADASLVRDSEGLRAPQRS